MNRKVLLLLVIMAISVNIIGVSIASAQNNVDLHLFHGQGCPHCAKEIRFLDSIKDKYPTLNIHMHETYFNSTERELFMKLAKAYNTKVEGVPTTFIDGKVFVGFSDRIAEQIESEIKRCENNKCENPIERINDKDTDNGTNKGGNDKEYDSKNRLTIPAVISASLVDSVNPCAFAVLIILLSTILISKNKKKALFSGIAFSLAIFISYFLMGLGLYSAIEASGISHHFYIIVAVLAIIIGLFNLKDYLWYGKWFVMEVPRSWRPKLRSIISSITSVPGAFGIGFIVSLFLLPCTSGPYIVILGLLAKVSTRAQAIPLLLLYNLIFILPMVLITLAIYYGLTTAEKAEEMRQKKLEILHLIAGVIILLLGIGMLIAVYLGMV